MTVKKNILYTTSRQLKALGSIYCVIGCVGGALLGMASLGIVGFILGALGGGAIGLVVKKFI